MSGGITVDLSSLHSWAAKLLSVLEQIYRGRKCTMGKGWRMHKAYFKVKEQ
jgi:putative transposase